jgi:hypothetical protein
MGDSGVELNLRYSDNEVKIIMQRKTHRRAKGDNMSLVVYKKF